jgi:hypothetical protein
MSRINVSEEFYKYVYKGFIDYLATTFFLDKEEGPPQEGDLLKHIHDTSRDCEFIDFLILKIHQLTYVENYGNEMRTAIFTHLENTKSKKGVNNEK